MLRSRLSRLSRGSAQGRLCPRLGATFVRPVSGRDTSGVACASTWSTSAAPGCRCVVDDDGGESGESVSPRSEGFLVRLCTNPEIRLNGAGRRFRWRRRLVDTAATRLSAVSMSHGVFADTKAHRCRHPSVLMAPGAGKGRTKRNDGRGRCARNAAKRRIIDSPGAARDHRAGGGQGIPPRNTARFNADTADSQAVRSDTGLPRPDGLDTPPDSLPSRGSAEKA